MDFLPFSNSVTDDVVSLYTRVFVASEGEVEGNNIGKLVSNLVADTEPSDLIGCIATENETIVGCIFFSRFIVPSDRVAFLLSPVAISTEVQRTGIGQRLIEYGLEILKARNVNLVFTYGDPAFYSKTGFQQISEDLVKPPFKLSQPAGWLAQSLSDEPIEAMHGLTRCVQAFNNPDYW